MCIRDRDPARPPGGKRDPPRAAARARYLSTALCQAASRARLRSSPVQRPGGEHQGPTTGNHATK
eukprot:15094286-Alexandrium_andersonii.AAC.1